MNTYDDFCSLSGAKTKNNVVLTISHEFWKLTVDCSVPRGGRQKNIKRDGCTKIVDSALRYISRNNKIVHNRPDFVNKLYTNDLTNQKSEIKNCILEGTISLPLPRIYFRDNLHKLFVQTTAFSAYSCTNDLFKQNLKTQI